jgi:hypothetical protein
VLRVFMLLPSNVGDSVQHLTAIIWRRDTNCQLDFWHQSARSGSGCYSLTNLLSMGYYCENYCNSWTATFTKVPKYAMELGRPRAVYFFN